MCKMVDVIVVFKEDLLICFFVKETWFLEFFYLFEIFIKVLDYFIIQGFFLERIIVILKWFLKVVFWFRVQCFYQQIVYYNEVFSVMDYCYMVVSD